MRRRARPRPWSALVTARQWRDYVTAMTAFGNAAEDDDGGGGGGRLLQLTYVTVLDGGTFGTVYRAVLSAAGGGGGTARTVAVKRIRSPGGGRHELDVHRRLQHPNVVRLLFHFYSGNERNVCRGREYYSTSCKLCARRHFNTTRSQMQVDRLFLGVLQKLHQVHYLYKFKKKLGAPRHLPLSHHLINSIVIGVYKLYYVFLLIYTQQRLF